jgi:enterochelin esterase family protein
VNGAAITFRIYAPEAAAVTVESEIGAGRSEHPMTKAEDGVWSAVVEAPPGSYRYVYRINGVAVLDPRNIVTSQSNNTVRSVVHVDGLAYQDMADVPHGAVSEVWYSSSEFGGERRMHVYTPPGYETGTEPLPVLYLFHGAGDADDSWSTVGRAGVILDNLIAAGDAVPMIVVMPWGHAPSGGFTPGAPGDPLDDPILRDVVSGIIPEVEARYRVIADADHRAIAGLSMGGGHSSRLGLFRPDLFHNVGVFSAGMSAEAVTAYAASQADVLRQSQESMKLLYVSTGVNDFAHEGFVTMVGLLDDFGFEYVKVEDEGDHSWPYWRRYLNDMAPRLFR